MTYAKWIGGWLGWINSQSVLGAIAGFAIGTTYDAISGSKTVTKVDFDQPEYWVSSLSNEEFIEFTYNQYGAIILLLFFAKNNKYKYLCSVDTSEI